jgi:hypothetical protein
MTTRSCTTISRWCAFLYDYFTVVCDYFPLFSEERSFDCTAYYLPASTEIGYFKQLNISTIRNGTAGASGTDPASGYK